MEALEDQAPSSGSRRTTAHIAVGAATGLGRREINADVHLADHAAGFYAVADGAGDTPRSRLAAEKALAAVRGYFTAEWLHYAPAERPVAEALGRLSLGADAANRHLYAPWVPPNERMGTTFAGVVVCGAHLAVGHLGDSRVYLLRTSKRWMGQQTEDHTVFAEARRAGEPYDVALGRRDAHVLTRVVGVHSAVHLSPFALRWEPGDIVVLTTNGVSDGLGPEAMMEIILDAPDLDTAARQIVDLAAAHDGWDNATVLLVGHDR